MTRDTARDSFRDLLKFVDLISNVDDLEELVAEFREENARNEAILNDLTMAKDLESYRVGIEDDIEVRTLALEQKEEALEKRELSLKAENDEFLERQKKSSQFLAKREAELENKLKLAQDLLNDAEEKSLAAAKELAANADLVETNTLLEEELKSKLEKIKKLNSEL